MTENQRVAIVTGAAGGIGRAMTRALLAAGIRVAGVDRDREPLEALAGSAREQGKGSELLTIQTDLTKDSAADEITKATRDRFGRIDILVNNAGIGPGAIRPDSWQRPLKFWEITADQWRRFVAVHTTAPLTPANAVAPEMMRQGWGRIVNVWRSPAADKGSTGPGLRAERQTKPISLAAFVPWRGSTCAAVRPQRQAMYNLTPMSVSGSAIISSSVWNSTITRITRKAGMIRTIARVNAA